MGSTKNLILTIVLFVVSSVHSFVTHRIGTVQAPRVKPIHENFFLDIAEDPKKNTPKEIYGEESYRTFVGSYDSNALLNGGAPYDIITRVRQLKLLTATADSGLLEALEAKGLTLSKIEALLPLIDELDLLSVAVQNRGLVIALAPLLIEPATAVLPLVVSVLRTAPSTFTSIGAVLAGAGAYETITDHAILGVPLVLLGSPLLLLGAVLGGAISLPNPGSLSSKSTSQDINGLSISASSSSRPMAARKIINTTVKASTSNKATPSVKVVASNKATPSVSVSSGTQTGGRLNGRRKTLKIGN